jgi:ribosome-binding factor A
MSKRNKRIYRRALPPCDQLGPDDGIDPREFFRRGGKTSDHRKTRQLCGQVFRALSLGLAELQGEWATLEQRPDQTAAQDLMIEAVDPSPDATRLRVTVSLCGGGAMSAAQEAMVRLQQQAGRLRWEVAQAITRKKAPELIFVLALDGEVAGG